MEQQPSTTLINALEERDGKDWRHVIGSVELAEKPIKLRNRFTVLAEHNDEFQDMESTTAGNLSDGVHDQHLTEEDYPPLKTNKNRRWHAMLRNKTPFRKMEVNSLEMEINSVGNVDSKMLMVTVDSGAAESVMNETHASSVPTRTSKGSITGVEYVNATGTTMPNPGEKILPVILNNGEECTLRMQITDADRALLGVSCVCDSGHTVTFRKGTGEPVIGFQQASVTNRSGGIAVSPICVKGMRQEVLPLDMSNEEIGAKEIDESADHMAEDIIFEDEFKEALEPVAASDPGAPTAKEIATHNLTHLPHQAWCPVCVGARSTHRPHWASKESEVHAVPRFLFRLRLLGVKGRGGDAGDPSWTRQENWDAVRASRAQKGPCLCSRRSGDVEGLGPSRVWTCLAEVRQRASFGERTEGGGALAGEGYDHRELARGRQQGERGGRARGQVIRGANAGNPSRASRSVASSHSWESRFDILDG